MDATTRAKEIFEQEINELQKLGSKIGDEFNRAVELIYSGKGKLVIMGIGKTGIIGHKIASSMASTGTPTIFVNAAEAMQLPAMAPTRQYAWSEVVARVKAIAAMAALSPSNLKMFDKPELQYMVRMMDASGMRAIITNQMKTDAPTILDMLNSLEKISKAS